jgi:hypothetical protein
MSGLGCPKCASPQLVVYDSRQRDDGRIRRRKCYACGHKFATLERALPEKVKPAFTTRKVDNPLFQPDHKESPTNTKQDVRVINMHESAVEVLFSKGHLDVEQKRAADRFRACWEAMGGKGASAIDYGKEVVDGGRNAQDITEHQWQAGEDLRRCHARLGDIMYRLVSQICGEGLGLAEYAKSRRARDTAADNLRTALDELSEMWWPKKPKRGSRAA